MHITFNKHTSDKHLINLHPITNFQKLSKNKKAVLKMTGSEYQKLASRTINNDLTKKGQEKHALHGLVGEIGELHSLYQKVYQGHEFDEHHAMSEVSDMLWFIAEYCTAMGWNLDDVMQYNIDKLIARYPDGFEADKSLHRAEGDI